MNLPPFPEQHREGFPERKINADQDLDQLPFGKLTGETAGRPFSRECSVGLPEISTGRVTLTPQEQRKGEILNRNPDSIPLNQEGLQMGIGT